MQVATLAPYEVFAEVYRYGPAFSEYILGGYSDCYVFFHTLASRGFQYCSTTVGHEAATVPILWHTGGGEGFGRGGFWILLKIGRFRGLGGPGGL